MPTNIPKWRSLRAPTKQSTSSLLLGLLMLLPALLLGGCTGEVELSPAATPTPDPLEQALADLRLGRQIALSLRGGPEDEDPEVLAVRLAPVAKMRILQVLEQPWEGEEDWPKEVLLDMRGLSYALARGSKEDQAEVARALADDIVKYAERTYLLTPAVEHPILDGGLPRHVRNYAGGRHIGLLEGAILAGDCGFVTQVYRALPADIRDNPRLQHKKLSPRFGKDAYTEWTWHYRYTGPALDRPE